MPEEYARLEKSIEWKSTRDLPNVVNIQLFELPWPYRTPKFLSTLPRVRRLLRDLIHQNSYLSFAIGGGIGDWLPLHA